MDAAKLVNAVDSLVVNYRNNKKGIEVKQIPASSLWLALGVGVTTWRKLDAALAQVKGAPLGSSYEPTWLRDHAAEVAALL